MFNFTNLAQIVLVQITGGTSRVVEIGPHKIQKLKEKKQ
jgi:hypothetical protein